MSVILMIGCERGGTTEVNIQAAQHHVPGTRTQLGRTIFIFQFFSQKSTFYWIVWIH